MKKQPTNVNEASRAVAAMPAARSVSLAGGRSAEVRRLNWMQFELLWVELAGLLAAFAEDGGTADPANLAAELTSAPQLVLKLVVQSAGMSEQELAGLPFDDVLAVAAAAIELNFTEPAGVRSFFLAASALLGPGQTTGTAAAAQPSTS